MKAILHIGDQKTGSKSIQTFIDRNAHVWRAVGTISPRSTKAGRYDMGLAALTRSRGTKAFRDYVNSQKIDDVGDVRGFLLRNLRGEVAGYHTAVFSFEGLLWMSTNEISILASHLRDLFDEFEIVVFLRRQDRKAVSLYSTKLLLGRGSLNLLPSSGDFDYCAALRRWSEEFGEARFAIYVYEEQADVSRTFGTHISQDVVAEYPERQNEGLGGKAQEVLTLLRTQYEDLLAPAPHAMELRQLIANHVRGGSKLIPSETAARQFMERFVDGNRQICKLFSLPRAELFDDDYSEYRRRADANTFTADDMAALALALWRRYETSLGALRVGAPTDEGRGRVV